jgi:hypothetical protein
VGRIMRLPSLELNWIRRQDKGLLLPAVVFADLENCGGYYVKPRRRETFIDGRYCDLERGLIAISTRWPDFQASTLAHEWRHHWQAEHGFSMEESWGFDADWDADYDQQLRRFFRTQAIERDALAFQCRHAFNQKCDQTLEILGLTRRTLTSWALRG